MASETSDIETSEVDTPATAPQPRMRRILRRLFPWVLVLFFLFLLNPIHYRVSRVLIVFGPIALWAVALYLWWGTRWLRTTLIIVAAIPLGFLILPGRPVDADALRDDYRTGLRLFDGAPYVWGGETRLGIDCSGFVREGLVVGQLWNGVRTLNGSPIRGALTMWWNDATAEALRDGADGATVELGRAESVNELDPTTLQVGDLAATQDGQHVLVYAGDRSWMQADPSLGDVVTLQVPSTNAWMKIPIVHLRWSMLADTSS